MGAHPHVVTFFLLDDTPNKKMDKLIVFMVGIQWGVFITVMIIDVVIYG